jgi:glycosyltransferase involved in cell wall biosynthesis
VNNIAGVPPALASAQRKLGVRADVLVFREDAAGFGYDFNLDVDRFPRLAQPFYRLAKLPSFLNYDVFHMHSASFVSGYIDAPFLRLLSKKIVYHHHGSDIRGKGLPMLSRFFCDARFVSTPDLLDWAPQAKWIPNAIDCSAIKPRQASPPKGRKPRKPRKLRFLHVPRFQRAHRKTDAVEKVFAELGKRYAREAEFAVFETKENIPRPAFLRELRRADVYVDNLGGGWYGMTALEAMLSQIPVCVYVREDLERFCDPRALANVNEKNLKETLVRLIEDGNERRRLGADGRAYVLRTHDSMKIARLVITEYEKLF